VCQREVNDSWPIQHLAHSCAPSTTGGADSAPSIQLSVSLTNRASALLIPVIRLRARLASRAWAGLGEGWLYKPSGSGDLLYNTLTGSVILLTQYL
jgi:hypothetical protein